MLRCIAVRPRVRETKGDAVKFMRRPYLLPGGGGCTTGLALEKYDPALAVQAVLSPSAAAVMGWTRASVSSSRHFAVPPRRNYNGNNSRRRHGPRVGAALLPHNANIPGRNASSDVINCANSDGVFQLRQFCFPVWIWWLLAARQRGIPCGTDTFLSSSGESCAPAASTLISSAAAVGYNCVTLSSCSCSVFFSLEISFDIW